MKKIKYIILTLALIIGFGLVSQSASAFDPFSDACSGDAASTALCKDKDKDQIPAFVKNLVNVLLYVLGAVSVIVIIFAGIFYATSNGDATLVTKAKNTLMYAVIGLIVAVMAYAIVNFVIGTFYPVP